MGNIGKRTLMSTIVWFREDLRLADNPALSAAAERGPVLPVFILNEHTTRVPGAASLWWLHHSLRALADDLSDLSLHNGDPESVLARLARQTGATAIYWNRRYSPWAIAQDTAVKMHLSDIGLEVRSFNAALLNEPWEIATGNDTPYKVFTPYWKAARSRPVAAPLPAPTITPLQYPNDSEKLTDWALTPRDPNWARTWVDHWQPGEAGAHIRLTEFLNTGLRDYGQDRDRPDLPATSRLSPHLHFGEISPRQIHAAVTLHAGLEPMLASDTEKFMSEVGWREFSHHLLYHFPTMVSKNWRPAFDVYPWRDAPKDLLAWQHGQTGYPFVDAGLRELRQTGFMHNRVRMIAASFLVKHLRIHWREGEAWFWNTLVDADAANNAAGWQWVTGSGADSAPYFRVFNPIIQGQKFDPMGAYVRRWCPELAELDTRFIHAPWEASTMELAAAGITLGKTYPNPIVDHSEARAAALEGYRKIKTL